jgi:hypothetical protein
LPADDDRDTGTNPQQPRGAMFISYRRLDSPTFAADLVTRFGDDHVFLDRKSIGPAADFVEALDEDEHRWEVSRAQRETEAESVAFIVGTVLGLAVGDVAATYVGGWTDGDPDTITAAQAAIHTAARSLLVDLEDHSIDPDPEGSGEGEPAGKQTGR